MCPPTWIISPTMLRFEVIQVRPILHGGMFATEHLDTSISLHTHALRSFHGLRAMLATAGQDLGYSLSAEGGLLGLGWIGEAIMSAHGELGAFFYLNTTGLVTPTVPASNATTSVVSSEVGCLYTATFLECRWYNSASRSTEDNRWPQIPNPSTIQGCRMGCETIVVGLWRTSAAILSKNSQGLLLISTFQLTTGPLSWHCTSGCSNQTTLSGWETPTSMRLWESNIVVGIPGDDEGHGRVELWASTAQDGSGRVSSISATETTRTSPPELSWRRVQTITGRSQEDVLRFGQALSARSRYLVVGAPGSRAASAAVVVYSLSTSEGSPHLERVCTVHHTAGSEFGISLDQSEQDDEHYVAVGAPGENNVFVLRLSQASGCEILTRLTRDASMTLDRFGAAVAMDSGFVWVGAPDYFGYAYGRPVFGLIYVFPYCSSRRRLQYYDFPLTRFTVSACALCQDGQWAQGGQATSCSSCVPAQSVATGGCNYVCKPGYFGPGCLQCSSYALASGMMKPNNSFWVNGQANCTWECNPMFALDQSTRKCVACNLTVPAVSIVWRSGICGWTCGTGYFNVTADTAPECLTCSATMQVLGTQKPQNSLWVDGKSECQWFAESGYNCSREAASCVPCPPKPGNSSWRYSSGEQMLSMCAYTCNPGFYGHPNWGVSVCVTCSELLTSYLPSHERPALPENAMWLDNVGTCSRDTWACKQGYYKSATDKICCPSAPPANADHSATASPCKFRCRVGYNLSASRTSCEECRSKPEGSEWLHGTDTCVWIPAEGYECQASTCTKCKAKPDNSQWKAGILTASTKSRCEYECSRDYYSYAIGQPQVPICAKCSEIMEVYKPEAQRTNLPPNAIWKDDLGFCTEQSWDCVSGFRKSLDPTRSICCPASVNNTYTDETSLMCGMRCNPGYTWASDWEAVCGNCPAEMKPTGSVWDRAVVNCMRDCDCKWKCEPGRYGAKEGMCVSCAEYMAEMSIAPPLHAYWAESRDGCNASSWVCKDGYSKSNEADPPRGACCPPADTVEHASSGGPAKDCGIQCEEGYSWSHQRGQCVYCSNYEPHSRPSKSYFNSSSCKWHCNPGLYPFPAEIPSRCLTCAELANAMQWRKPEFADWRSALEPGEECTEKVWECKDGYMRNGDSTLCCSRGSVVVPKDSGSLQGNWKPGACRWECVPGRFPRVPEFSAWETTGISCLRCNVYLALYGIPLCGEDTCDVAQDTDTCSAAVSAMLTIQGITTAQLRPAHHKVLRDALVNATRMSADSLKLIYVSSPQRRRQSFAASRVPSAVFVQMSLSDIEPPFAAGVRQIISSTVQNQILTLTFRAQGLPGAVQLVANTLAIEASPETRACKAPWRLNTVTGACCPSSTALPSADMRAERVMWDAAGCAIASCNPGFHLYKTTTCLTCAEMNAKLPEQKWVSCLSFHRLSVMPRDGGAHFGIWPACSLVCMCFRVSCAALHLLLLTVQAKMSHVTQCLSGFTDIRRAGTPLLRKKGRERERERERERQLHHAATC
jgi:hypothetical protein